VGVFCGCSIESFHDGGADVEDLHGFLDHVLFLLLGQLAGDLLEAPAKPDLEALFVLVVVEMPECQVFFWGVMMRPEGGWGGEELGADPAATVEEGEVEDPGVGEEGVWPGVDSEGDL
jgi:hypothetical protein